MLCLFTVSEDPWNDYDIAAALDPLSKYWMFANNNDEAEIITIELHVETTGWVGFGLSPNSKMKGSDFVLGWVKDGNTYFHVSSIFE